ncbi:MAG: hypothetical protein M0Z95_24065 [Actinomycetota bacterium]|jgi:hypothetical protein|nr:hypothetical protein [Actinomycetota bacterium]
MDRERVAGVVAGILVAASLLAGCTSVRNDLGTSSSVCYGALPAATQALHGQGRLDGVRLAAVSSLRRSAPHLYRAALAYGSHDVTRVCLVAFTGTFHSGDVDRPIGHPAGHIAVVELEYPGNRVVATLLVTRAPIRFGHSHLEIP